MTFLRRTTCFPIWRIREPYGRAPVGRVRGIALMVVSLAVCVSVTRAFKPCKIPEGDHLQMIHGERIYHVASLISVLR